MMFSCETDPCSATSPAPSRYLCPPPVEKPPNEPPPLRELPPLLWLLRQFWYSCDAAPKVLRVSLQSPGPPLLPQRNSIRTTATTNIQKKILASSDALKVVGSASRCSAARLSGARRKAFRTVSAESASPADQTTSLEPSPRVSSRFRRLEAAAPVPT